MLHGGLRGDSGEVALDDLVAVRRGGREVVEVGVKILGKAGAIRKVGDGPTRARGAVEGVIEKGLGGGCAE